MGTLTIYLQREFERLCPSGWTCHREMRVLSEKLEKTLGYSARADVMLERTDGSCRYWVEFEISRADPVANHVKFATGHLFERQATGDVFIAMVSPHVARGRRNLAANAISLMRCVGMSAFQTVLLPHNTGEEIRRWNETPVNQLTEQDLRVEDEIERLFAVTEVIASIGTRRVHLVGDLSEVVLNLRQFNLDLATAEGRALFGRRTITYFVYDPKTRQFAPSKFCAYAAVPQVMSTSTGDMSSRFHAEMTVAFYAELDEADCRFDGRVARLHLEKRLSMSLQQLESVPGLGSAFAAWMDQHKENIAVHPGGPQFLLPPTWF